MDEFRNCNDVQHYSKHKHDRTIIHIDLDCFYAQVEMLKNPELFSKPVGIKQQHYVITSNYVAREFGIRKCMLTTEALALCPSLIIINGEDLHDYRVMSSKVTDVIRQFSSKVEKLGLDENFIDVSDLVLAKLSSQNTKNSTFTVTGHIYKNEVEYTCTCGCRERLILGSQVASEIRERINNELGMTSCAGIGHNKLLAKLVCSTHKPNQQTTVFPCSSISLVSNLNNVRSIPGIGRKTSDVLEALGISSISDVQNCEIGKLEKHLGKTLAHWVKGASFGVDDMDVKESGKQQVIGLEEASKGINSLQDVNNKLDSLISRGMVLLQEDGRFPTTIRVSVRKYCREDYSRQRESKQCPINPSIFRSSAAKDYILETALKLFGKLVDHSKPFHLTLIGLAFTKFQEEVSPKSSLLQFFKDKSEKKLKQPLLESIDKESGSKCDSQYTTVETPKALMDSEVDDKSTVFTDIDPSVLNELPEDIKSEILQTNLQLAHKPGTSALQIKQNCVHCPPGIDPKVFCELPCDIQTELIEDANKKRPTQIAKSKTQLKRQNSILNYLKK